MCAVHRRQSHACIADLVAIVDAGSLEPKAIGLPSEPLLPEAMDDSSGGHPWITAVHL